MSSFDVHAKILHRGQYKIKKSSIDVPIKHFDEGIELEKNVQERINMMNLEIIELEEQLREKRRLSQEQAEKIIEQAQDEAKKVLEDAEQHAFDRIQKSVHDKEIVLQQTSEEVERVRAQAVKEADDIKNEAQKDSLKIKEQAQQDGHSEGLNTGIEAGRREVSFAVERLHGIIAETARERERILVHSEHQVINLVLTMVKKVVKKMSIEHQDVVIENIKAALELLRGAMTLFIRVSPYDFNYTRSFKEELVRMIESKAELKFIEDPTVEPGGVYIETDTGDVDATIRSQLEELENQMRFYMPVKVHPPEQKHAEEVTIDDPEIKKDIPKTDFAQREEYTSTITINDSSTDEEIVIEDDDQNKIDDIPRAEDTATDNQILDEYQKNMEQSSEDHDDIVV